PSPNRSIMCVSRGAVYEARLRRRGTVAVPQLWARRDEPAVARVLAGICTDHPDVCRAGDLATLRRASEAPLLDAAYGTAVVPLAISALGGDDAARARATRVLSAVVGRAVTFAPGGPPADRERALAHWKEWWFQNERDYAAYGPARRALGLVADTQYAKWILRIVTLSFGESMRDGRPVEAKIADAFPITAALALCALFLAYLIAIPLGVYSAVRHDTLGDRIVTVIVFVLYSLPSFWVASMLILLFGGVGFWDIFPIYGLASRGAEAWALWPRLLDRAAHMVLPIFCLCYGSLAVISRYQRSGLLDVVRQDYIRTARAKGLSERAVIFKHALRNSLIPVITLLGLQIPFLLGGAIILERIFTIPGMGRLTFEAIWFRDYPVIMGVTTVAAVLTMASVLLADVLYSLVDPRIAYEER
ncbi:MAG: ABC transporter permease, partial [Myxococcota bacterium]